MGNLIGLYSICIHILREQLEAQAATWRAEFAPEQKKTARTV